MRNLISNIVSFTILALAILISFAYASSYPMLGISNAINITPDIASTLQLDRPYGVLIIAVQPGSPIDKAGIRGSTVMGSSGAGGGGQITLTSVGDIIISVDGKRIESTDDLYPILNAKHTGDTIRLTIVRGAGEVRTTIQDVDVLLS